MQAPREVELVFLIADLSGYTALTEAHGNVEAAKLLARYVELAEAALPTGAVLVERVGDEVLVAAPDPALAVSAAVRLRQAVDREPRFPAVRIGVHAGPVLEDGGRYFGRALNVTARVAGYARAGQILCTEPVAAAAGALPGVEYRALGAVRLRNLVEPVPLVEVVTGQPADDRTAADPVCRMRVPHDTAAARLTVGDAMFYFCSLDCARSFLAGPERYA